ncbi:manganese-binding transcriptional regulator MntR [Alienimonas chondri]|uniref:Transcriptional regulator MntR n=1 Tax=Alienimonas chondri TaxID=2681879 RepID=A0ABX1VHP3_9PLAN|nr:manganese-binding transcriptional regulator MntR [Alienimonas chondri]NNJ26783.1 Transcriptional regulator MntR [Alienimonas chondri]
MSLPPPTDKHAVAAPERHRRTRRDHASETAEDYVEAIREVIETRGACRVSDLAERFSVSHVTVTRTVGRLVRDGLAETAPRAPITLTPVGARLASACRERHLAVLAFLRALGVSEPAAQLDAEGIEHHVSEETLAAMRRFVQQQTSRTTADR